MRQLIFLFLLVTSAVACNKSDKAARCNEPDLNCGGVACLVTTNLFDFRIVDKTSGADLVFGPSPRYGSDNISLFVDAAHTQPLTVTVDNAAKLFRTTGARTTMYLGITGQPDKKITATFKKIDCCSNRIMDLSFEGKETCTCCSDAIELKID